MWATSRGWTRCARAAHVARRSSRAISGFKTLDAPLDTALAGKVLERLPSASAARKSRPYWTAKIFVGLNVGYTDMV